MLDSSGSAGPGIVPSLEAVRRAGALVVVATARAGRSALNAIANLRLDLPMGDAPASPWVIASRGADIRRINPPGTHPPLDGQWLAAHAIDPDAARELARVARRHGWYCQVVINHAQLPGLGPRDGWRDGRDVRVLTSGYHEGAELYGVAVGMPVERVGFLWPYLRRGVTSAAMALSGPAEARAAAHLLAAELGGAIDVVAGYNYVECFPAGVTKGSGVLAVCESLGILPAETAVAGNDGLDVSMAAVAGYAIVVDGAPPDLLALADLVCDGPDRGGVAAALRFLGFHRPDARLVRAIV